MIRFELPLTGRGWAEARISDGPISAAASASYISDGIRDFIGALQSLFLSAQTASCSFAEEPGEFRWEFERVASSVRIRLAWLPEGGSHELLFDGSHELVAFAKQVDAVLDRLLAEWGAEGYEQEWGYPFPHEAHLRLKQGITR